MKLKNLILLLLLFTFSNYIFAEGDGFGENPGGAGGDTVTVDNTSDLKKYAGLSTPYVIFIKDTIDVGSALTVKSYKTISGIDTFSTIIGDIKISGGTNNVVVKNLNITNPNNDGITIRNAQYIYVTNCTVYDCKDGCIDVTVESDFVTISYCRFYYEEVIHHKFVNLIGASDDDVTDEGKLHVTMHHNWWDKNCACRMPRVRFGRVHLYNNYYSCEDNQYASRAAIDAQILSEYNYFDSVRDPLTVDQNGKAKSEGNEYINCSGITYEGNDDVFAPSYYYQKTSATEAKNTIIKSAGNTANNLISGNNKKETFITWSDQEEILYGTKLSETQLNATADGNTSTPVYSPAIGTVLPEGYNTITVTFPEDESYKAASKTVNIKVNYEYKKLTIKIPDGVDSDLIGVSPEGTENDSCILFPKGTEVALTASSDAVSTFKQWGDGDTCKTKTITMDEDVEIYADYEQQDFVVAWDLYESGNRNRTADYYMTDDNENALMQLKHINGGSTAWKLYSAKSDNALLGRNTAMLNRGKSSADSYFFQISFNASQFKEMKISTHMLGIKSYYQEQNVEYSVDGENFDKIGSFNLEQDSVWYSGIFNLPDNANGEDTVIVRFIGNTGSSFIENGNLGTCISEIYVYGDKNNSTSVPIIAKKESNLVSKEYYSIDGRKLQQPSSGINIEIKHFSDGSTKARKVIFAH